MFNFKPKENIFFKLLIEVAVNAHNASLALDKLVNNYVNSDEIVKEIIDIESNGDSLKHKIEIKLEETFITPFDREDIFQIIKKIDKYVNFTQSIALRFKILHIKEITEPTKLITKNLVLMTEHLIILMENLNDKKKSIFVKEAIIKINQIETQIDDIFRTAISQLFENPSDILDLIKWKEIYQSLEDAADSCEEIATAIEGVITKNE